jgi:hypothetical protein
VIRGGKMIQAIFVDIAGFQYKTSYKMLEPGEESKCSWSSCIVLTGIKAFL